MDRSIERNSSTKAFALNPEQLASRSAAQKFDAFPEFKQAKEARSSCMLYAWAYADTMMSRIEQENPDVYSDKGMTRPELCTYLANNMCMPIEKMHSRVFRETVAKIHEKEHLNDDIRRLVNGGHKFHPYM